MLYNSLNCKIYPDNLAASSATTENYSV